MNHVYVILTLININFNNEFVCSSWVYKINWNYVILFHCENGNEVKFPIRKLYKKKIPRKDKMLQIWWGTNKDIYRLLDNVMTN